MTTISRVLPSISVGSIDDHIERRGGFALRTARALDPWDLIELLEVSGLRGRGGGGFPTGRKWRTVRENLAESLPTTVVVNSAEGEPGTFKDRALWRRNPYRVLEGALIAAHAVSAPRVVVALKRSFGREVATVKAAVRAMKAAGWDDGIELVVHEGPDEYLFGEETALLESLNGRAPLPRIAPPFRRGVTDVVESVIDLRTGSGLPAHVEMAETGEAPPALVDNVETLANVPMIVDRGVDWFRTVGTDRSPGTIVCTITGQVARPGVGEVPMGTTLREAIDAIGGGPNPDRRIVAVMPGVSSSLLPVGLLDTPLTYEDMAAAGSGLGSAGFIVLDDTTDPVAAVAGASRFLAIESCGQCSPCKQDGLALSDLLARLAASEATTADVATICDRVGTVADGSRCSIGSQHEAVVEGLLVHFADVVRGHVDGSIPGCDPLLVADLVDLRDEVVELDEDHRTKQPDWTHDPVWSGETPVDRFTDHRADHPIEAGH